MIALHGKTILLTIACFALTSGRVLAQEDNCFGIIAGIGTFLWEWLDIGETLFMFLAGASPANLGIRAPILPCLTFLLFAFFGLALPGYMLKRKSL